METLNCNNNCCNLLYTKKYVRYSIKDKINSYKNRKDIKAGLILIDSNNRILVSQSYNNYWGIPKGSCEKNEHPKDAARRETYEETGVLVDQEVISETTVTKSFVFIVFKKIYIFYMVKLNYNQPQTLAPNFLSNESTGCGWIKIDCIWKLIKSEKIKVNNITKKVLSHIVKENTFIDFPITSPIKVSNNIISLNVDNKPQNRVKLCKNFNDVLKESIKNKDIEENKQYKLINVIDFNNKSGNGNRINQKLVDNKFFLNQYPFAAIKV